MRKNESSTSRAIGFIQKCQLPRRSAVVSSAIHIDVHIINLLSHLKPRRETRPHGCELVLSSSAMRCLRLLVLCFLFLRAPFPLPVCACALFSRGRNIKSDDDGSQESTVVAVVVVEVMEWRRSPLLPPKPPKTLKTLAPKPFHLNALEKPVRFIYSKFRNHGKLPRYGNIGNFWKGLFGHVLPYLGF